MVSRSTSPNSVANGARGSVPVRSVVYEVFGTDGVVIQTFADLPAARVFAKEEAGRRIRVISKTVSGGS